jgi:hypothetical protein
MHVLTKESAGKERVRMKEKQKLGKFNRVDIERLREGCTEDRKSVLLHGTRI